MEKERRGGGEGGVGGGWRVGRVVRTRRRGFRPVTGRVAEDNSRENRGNERDNEGEEGEGGEGGRWFRLIPINRIVLGSDVEGEIWRILEKREGGNGES